MKRRKIPSWFSPLISGLVLVALLAVFMARFSGNEPTQEGLMKLKSAVETAAIQCYALEGAYPESIEYLEQHYGLSVDHSRFLISYRVEASNLIPTITVIAADGSGSSMVGGELS